jgi:hypothetical protein
MVMSSTEAVAAPTKAPEAPRPAAVDPSKVPLLPGEAPKPVPVAPADPKADFAPLAKRSQSSFDPVRSKSVSRSMYGEEFENPDGTRTVRQSTMPLNVKESDGQWRPVDVSRDRGAVEAVEGEAASAEPDDR